MSARYTGDLVEFFSIVRSSRSASRCRFQVPLVDRHLQAGLVRRPPASGAVDLLSTGWPGATGGVWLGAAGRKRCQRLS
jgi:hypothetical protein